MSSSESQLVYSDDEKDICDGNSIYGNVPAAQPMDLLYTAEDFQIDATPSFRGRELLPEEKLLSDLFSVLEHLNKTYNSVLVEIDAIRNIINQKKK